jgi:hypothetical protein
MTYLGPDLLKLLGNKSIEVGDNVAALAIATCCSNRNAI